MPKEFGVKGLQLFFVSPSGERLGIVSDSDLSGSVLDFSLTTVNMGGVDTFSFHLPRDNSLPLSRNTEVLVQVDGALWFSGFLDEIPEPDQYSPLLKFKGLGFFKRLQKKILNQNFKNQTLKAVVTSVFSSQLGASLGVYWNATKTNVPSLNNISINFEDVPLLEALIQLLKIANHDYENHKYRFFVDNDRELVIEEYGETPLKGVFEGFQYHTPEVSIDNSRIVNKILCYRASNTDKNKVAYALEVQDENSIQNYGLFEKKLVVPSYVDSTTLQCMANFLVTRNKTPQKTIAIDDIVAEEVLKYGLYHINNRRLPYWEILNDCDSLEGWNFSHLRKASVSLSDEHILTGRRALKFEINNSNEDYCEFTLRDKVFLPQKVRAYVYFTDTPLPLQIHFFDSQGNSLHILLGVSDLPLDVSIDGVNSERLQFYNYGENQDADVSQAEEVAVNQWLLLEQQVGLETSLDFLLADKSSVDRNLPVIVNIDEDTEEPLVVRSDVQAYLLNISKIRITILTDEAGSFYIDRLDTFADVYKRSSLLLESANYQISETKRAIRAVFGEKVPNIIDEIKEKTDSGDTALAVFAKR